MKDEPVSPAILEKVHNALNPKPVEAPAQGTQTPPVVPADGGRPRNEKGQFEPKQETPATPGKPELTPEARGLLAAVRAERERRKESEAKSASLEQRIAEIEARANKPREDRRSDLLKNAPEDTQKFWKEIGDPLVEARIDERVAQILEPYKPAIETAKALREREGATRAFQSDLAEFIEDAALEGQSIDPVALVDTITRFEKEYDISLGSSNRKKFENALGMMGALPKPDRAVADAAQKAKEEADAAAKARAGGVAPGSAATVPPPDTRTAMQKGVRELAHKGDVRSIADLIAKRVPKHPLLASRP